MCMFWQIHDEAKKFAYQTGVKVVVAYGGTPINQQVIIIHSFFSSAFVFGYCFTLRSLLSIL